MSCCLLCAVSMLHSRIPTKNRALFYTEEKVHGRLFSHRIELLEGRQKDLWRVDGEEVDYPTYEELILEAEKEERRQERKREYEERIAHHLFKQQAHESLLKKLLSIVVDEIREEVKLLGRYSLQGYFVYAPTTITDHDDYKYLAHELLSHAERLLRGEEEFSYDDLVALHGKLELYGGRLKQFARATISRAIDQCDDTKLLKDLLVLVT